MPDTSPAKPRGPYTKGVQRRAEIVEAATYSFARAGFTGAAISAVAEEVGLTVPGVLHYFPSKVDLLLAVLEKRDVDAMAAHPSDPENWQAALRNLVIIARHNVEIEGVIRAFAILQGEALGDDHPASEWFIARTARVRDQITGQIARGQAKGEVTPDEVPQDLASEIIATMDGLQLQWLADRKSVDMAGIMERYIERLIRAISI